MIGTIDIEIQAKNPNMALWPLRAYVNSPSSLRLRNVPKKIGQWEITSVQVNVNYPDKTQKTTQCVLVGGVWVGTVEGSSATGSYTNGYTVLANGTDENGNPVSGYVLGRGDVEILKEDGTPIADDPTHFVTDDELESAISSKAEISVVDDVANDLTDLSNSLSNYYIKTETSSTVELDAKFETKADLSALNEVESSLSDYYIKTETSSATEIQNALDGKQPTGDYALVSQIPLSVSQLENDAGYLTEHQSLSDYYTKSETSSSNEISIAFGSKQDNLTPLQLLALSTEIDENKTMLVGGYSNGYYVPVYVDWYGEVTQEMVSDTINQIDESYRYSIGVRLGTAVSAIGISAFANTKVTEVYAPQNVVYVKDYAFANSDLRRIKFDYSEGRYTPIVIGDYVFQGCSSLMLADIPADHSINIGVSAFDGCPFTIDSQESIYPYYYGLYFNRPDNHAPEVTPGSMTLLPNFPWGLSSTSVIKFGTTASRYWVECQHYGKDTLYATGGITMTGNRPNNRAYWLGVDDNTNTTFTLTATATTQVRIHPTNRTTGKMYNAYLALSADEDITRPFVWYSLSGSYAFDKFQDEYIQNNPIESGKINYYHIYEYQPDHFAVEKLGWTEEQLSAKTDISALNAVESSLSNYALVSQIPLSVSQLENDAGYLTEHQSLSDYYTKNETSSNAEINTALNLKQDTLTSEQLSNIARVPYIDPANTIVTFDDDSVGVYNVVGELTQNIKQEWERLADAYVKDIKIGTNVNALGNSLFYRAYNNILTKVTIPNSVTSIGSGAFSGCTSLTKVTIPNSVTNIANSVFLGCSNLTRVTIPSSVTSIEGFAFRSCTSLSSVAIPESTTNIGENAFRQSGITNITIPNNISSIGTDAFNSCTNLTSLTFKGKTLAEVQAMSNYPWGISDTSIIKTWNDASQEWVLEQLSALEVRIAALENN